MSTGSQPMEGDATDSDSINVTHGDASNETAMAGSQMETGESLSSAGRSLQTDGFPVSNVTPIAGADRRPEPNTSTTLLQDNTRAGLSSSQPVQPSSSIALGAAPPTPPHDDSTQSIMRQLNVPLNSWASISHGTPIECLDSVDNIQKRIESFTKNDHKRQWVEDTGHSWKPAQLALGGFSYAGYGHVVKCEGCSLNTGYISPDVTPLDFHFRHGRPDRCAYLRGLGPNFRPEQPRRQQQRTMRNHSDDDSDEDMNVLGPFSQPASAYFGDASRRPDTRDDSCAMLPTRLKTFDNWYRQQPKKESLAEAGFYYLGKDDLVRCFQCGGALERWRPADDPWEEHARWYPQCSYLINVKGQPFVQEVQLKMAHEAKQLSVVNFSEDELKFIKTSAEVALYYRNMLQDIAKWLIEKRLTSEFCQLSWRYFSVPLRFTDFESTCKQLELENQLMPAKLDLLKLLLTNIKAVEAVKFVDRVEHQIVVLVDEFCRKPPKQLPEPEGTSLEQLPEQQRRLASAAIELGFSKNEVLQVLARQPIERDISRVEELVETLLSEGPNVATPAVAQRTASVDIRGDSESTASTATPQDDRFLCKICLERPLSITFLPCGHFAACGICYPPLQQCPICRTHVTGVIKTYLP